jgi:MoaA/NifB/PqqE/SkfB family radical SAM enzyme
MASSGLLPYPDHDENSYGRFLTFVVPAPTGCNLSCAFCLIGQRRETRGPPLNPEELARFVHEAAERGPIFAVAIQGYEPLLRDALPYTRALLATSRLLRVPSTLVTNGVLLADAIDLLAVLKPTKIAISLDAATPEAHDQIRGVNGAWAAAVDGIKQAVERLAPQTRLAVSSVLLPSRRSYLEGMPARLRDLCVDRWIVNPLLRIGRENVGGPVVDRQILFEDLLALGEAARKAGIRFTVDDEFNRLDHASARARRPELHSLHVRTLPRGIEIFRLSPSGQASVGDDILRQVTPDLPRWRPGIHAGDFLDSLSRPPV